MIRLKISCFFGTGGIWNLQDACGSIWCCADHRIKCHNPSDMRSRRNEEPLISEKRMAMVRCRPKMSHQIRTGNDALLCPLDERELVQTRWMQSYHATHSHHIT